MLGESPPYLLVLKPNKLKLTYLTGSRSGAARPCFAQAMTATSGPLDSMSFAMLMANSAARNHTLLDWAYPKMEALTTDIIDAIGFPTPRSVLWRLIAIAIMWRET